jgi:hypothetical protein
VLVARHDAGIARDEDGGVQVVARAHAHHHARALANAHGAAGFRAQGVLDAYEAEEDAVGGVLRVQQAVAVIVAAGEGKG